MRRILAFGMLTTGAAYKSIQFMLIEVRYIIMYILQQKCKMNANSDVKITVNRSLKIEGRVLTVTYCWQNKKKLFTTISWKWTKTEGVDQVENVQMYKPNHLGK
ncbi:hypothetical protein CEXT_146821 [Caerostris extrusa]|uniref:Uncharacterized protein n=1 Tax=Caerostris extrusa TaxID=172846 RepID=A0AAV4MHN6_CAEEX|nr:hypothetical protein CEXT_146821 [Caerostris extrusa]